MPAPSVEPRPPEAAELRFTVPLDAQDASYLAASERMARRSFSDFFMSCSLNVLAYPAKIAPWDTDRGTMPNLGGWADQGGYKMLRNFKLDPVELAPPHGDPFDLNQRAKAILAILVAGTVILAFSGLVVSHVI